MADSNNKVKDDPDAFNFLLFLQSRPPRALNRQLLTMALAYTSGQPVNKALLGIVIFCLFTLFSSSPWLLPVEMITKNIKGTKVEGRLISYEQTHYTDKRQKVYRVKAAFQGPDGEVEFVNYYTGWADVPGHERPAEPQNAGSLNGQVEIEQFPLYPTWSLLPEGRLSRSSNGAVASLVVAAVCLYYLMPGLRDYFRRRRLVKNGGLS